MRACMGSRRQRMVVRGLGCTEKDWESEIEMEENSCEPSAKERRRKVDDHESYKGKHPSELERREETLSLE